jgi:ATP-binding cassette, subfamily C (CFTR/MRP), member 1
MLLPRALAAVADSKNAFERLRKVFEAPVMEGAPFVVDPAQSEALVVEHATFEWEETMAEKERREQDAAKKGKKGKGGEKEKGKGKQDASEKKAQDPAGEKPFAVKDVSLSVPKGSLIAIVGPVGCGKSSLLQGFIGEMRKVLSLFSSSLIERR